MYLQESERLQLMNGLGKTEGNTTIQFIIGEKHYLLKEGGLVSDKKEFGGSEPSSYFIQNLLESVQHNGFFVFNT